MCASTANSTPQPPAPTLASIGTVLIDIFEPRSPTPYSPSPPTPRSPASSLPTSCIVTPNMTPSHRPHRLPSLESLNTPHTPQLSMFGEPSSSGTPMIGGGALYALVGARVWLPAKEMRTVIDRGEQPNQTRRRSRYIKIAGDEEDDIHTIYGAGSSASSSNSKFEDVCYDEDDFPIELEHEIRQFGDEMWCFNSGPDLRIPRARIAYDGDVRTYQHVVKPSLRTGAELAAGPLLGAEYLHVSPPYGPSDLLQLLDEIDETGTGWNPKVVFEPTPSSCHPGSRAALERVAGYVEVLSPNHEELLSFYGVALPDSCEETCEAVEGVMRHLLNSVGVGAEGKGVVVVRCGAIGACVGTRAGGLAWTPAYWATDSDRVRDVTGAGNAFIGGFVAGLKLTHGNPYAAVLYGTVSSSFVVEQLGLPAITPSSGLENTLHRSNNHHHNNHFTALGLLAAGGSPPHVVEGMAALKLRAAAHIEMWNEDTPQRRLEYLRVRARIMA